MERIRRFGEDFLEHIDKTRSPPAERNCVVNKIDRAPIGEVHSIKSVHRSANRNLTVSTAGKSAQERSEWDDRFMRRVWLRLSSSSRAGADRVFGYCDR